MRQTRRNSIIWGAKVALALAVFVTAPVLPGCTAETPELELAEEDRAALASLGYVANELTESGGADTEKRVLVLGIDGMDWLITTRMLDEGKLPHFRALANEGGFSPLLSSIPPQSPVAWSNFITGADPGGHGIFDFVHRDRETYLPYLSTSKVEPAPEKARVLGIPVRNRFAMPFTDYVFPLAGGATLNLRKGVAFWQVLEAA
ncbi:MAG: alkaline phosphatase family protein, partial [Candidatus Eisenbacteria sp.]|nr:alkaline phosphatase family protein [Candidatus Eisenbacteria bacterium]